MFCPHCNTPFEIVPINEGKSKYCKKCGHLIYKKENQVINIYHPMEITSKADDEHELRENLIREKEFRYKEQLERKQKEQEFRERLEKVRLLKEKEEQLKRQKEREEQERLFLLEQIRIKNEKEQQEKKLQLEQEAALKIQNEKEVQQKLMQIEIENQKKIKEKMLLEQLEAEKQERERLEKELLISEQKYKEEKEKAEYEKLKLATIEKTRIEQAQIKSNEKEKETARINLPADNNQQKTVLIKNIPSVNKNWSKFTLPILAGIILTLSFLYFKDKISSLSKFIKTKTVLASADSNFSSNYNEDFNADTILLLELKNNLSGHEILSWNEIKNEDIKNFSILSVLKNNDNTQYKVSVDLDDKKGTKAFAELNLNYSKIILDKIETLKITYRNIAPINAWFKFAPVSNCTISVNTNNNPIKIKFCDDCSISKMVSNSEQPKQIESVSNIYIKSDNKHDAVVEFSYIPLNINQ